MKESNNTLFIALILVLLAACQTNNTLQNTYTKEHHVGVLLDSSFNGYQYIAVETESEIFALSKEMKAIAKRIGLERDTRKKANKLLMHFFDPDNISLAYRSGANVIAAQAYQNKEANCLSLTIMAYAIAKEAKLDVAFQSVNVPEYWVRNGRINMLTGHINLAVIPDKPTHSTLFLQRTSFEIDFDPFVNKKSFPKHRIYKNTVLAMFYNNKGANAMINGDDVTAYAYLKRATELDPLFSPAWGNLGILYRFNGYEQSAMETYRYAINLNSNNLTAMANLSMLLHSNGGYEEAKKIDMYLMHKRANNPYYYALLGDEKLYKGAYHEAIKHYKKAIKLNDNIHEFYFALAKAYFMLDKVAKAENYLRKAIQKNRVAQLEEQYIAKLNVFKQKNGDH